MVVGGRAVFKDDKKKHALDTVEKWYDEIRVTAGSMILLVR